LKFFCRVPLGPPKIQKRSKNRLNAPILLLYWDSDGFNIIILTLTNELFSTLANKTIRSSIFTVKKEDDDDNMILLSVNTTTI